MMNVTVDVMELDKLFEGKVSESKNKEAAKAWMDCRQTIFDYLCGLYKEQTGIDPNDMTGMFKHVTELK